MGKTAIVFGGTGLIGGSVLAELLADARYAEVNRPGDPLDLRIRIRNLTDEACWVVGSLDGSDSGRPPHYTARILDEKGKEVPVKLPQRCGNANGIRDSDFARLRPGEEFDPYREIDAYGFFGNWVLQSWRPAAAGRYTVVLTVDFTERDPKKWAGWKAEVPDGLKERLSKIPKVRIEAHVEIVVR